MSIDRSLQKVHRISYHLQPVSHNKYKCTANTPISKAVFGGSTMPDTPEMRAYATQIAALGRIGAPDDIGGIAAFLCSEDARWINGQRIEATGGVGL